MVFLARASQENGGRRLSRPAAPSPATAEGPPGTEESSLPCWAQSPGKEKTESEDLEEAWGPQGVWGGADRWPPEDKGTGRPEHAPGVRHSSPGHCQPPGSRQANNSATLGLLSPPALPAPLTIAEKGGAS